jgi:lysophospholipase L1-like esterase
MKTRFFFILIIIILGIFGCTQTNYEPPTQQPSNTLIFSSVTPEPQATIEPTITSTLIFLSPTPEPQATIEPTITPRQINYVALGDSIPGCWGVGLDCFPYYFADYLQQDLGREVLLQNMAITGDRTAHLLDHLQNDAKYRQAVANANVITIWIGVNDLPTPQLLYMNGSCGGEDNLNCVRKSVSETNENIDRILDEILALNTDEDTRIMIADNAIPQSFVDDWKDHGCLDVLNREIYGAMQEHLIKAVNERGIILVPTAQIINGPLGDQESANLYIEDKLHFNKDGHRLIADIFRETWQ